MEYLIIRVLISLVCMGLAAKQDHKSGEIEDWTWILMLLPALFLLFLDPQTVWSIYHTIPVTAIPLFILLWKNLIGSGDVLLLVSLQALTPLSVFGVPIAMVAFIFGGTMAFIFQRNRKVWLVPYLFAGFIVGVILS